MSNAGAALVWLLSGVLLANWPFLTERFFFFFHRLNKSFASRLVELGVGYALLLLLGFALEASVSRVQEQTWNFYAITLCIFVLMAYPGFVWRYLRRGRLGRGTTPVNESVRDFMARGDKQ